MLIKIGSVDEPSDIVDLLIACHERIRFFVDLARRLAAARDLSRDEITNAATHVIRYFSESLPLHVADEEESIMPRLLGRSPELDTTLEAMRREHELHEPQLQALLNACRILQTAPDELEKLRDSLGKAASALEKDFIAHLREEENVVLPAIRSLLSSEERDAMLAELRARRVK
jgi:hemerythrin-like domain-containing protein